MITRNKVKSITNKVVTEKTEIRRVEIDKKTDEVLRQLSGIILEKAKDGYYYYRLTLEDFKLYTSDEKQMLRAKLELLKFSVSKEESFCGKNSLYIKWD